MSINKIAPNEMARIKATFKRAIELLETMEQKGCESCKQWNGKGCKLAGGDTPPEKVQTHGCGSYESDGVPF